MCQRVTCRKCGKATYSGCGQHVDQVLAGVPASQRCTCSKDSSGSGRGWKLFGRCSAEPPGRDGGGEVAPPPLSPTRR